MLEILLLIWLCRKVGAIAREKGRGAVGYQFLMVGMWVGGEIGGLILGAIFTTPNPSGGINPLAYLVAIGLAIAGAISCYVIVNSLSDLTSQNNRQRGFAVTSRTSY